MVTLAPISVTRWGKCLDCGAVFSNVWTLPCAELPALTCACGSTRAEYCEGPRDAALVEAEADLAAEEMVAEWELDWRDDDAGARLPSEVTEAERRRLDRREWEAIQDSVTPTVAWGGA